MISNLTVEIGMIKLKDGKGEKSLHHCTYSIMKDVSHLKSLKLQILPLHPSLYPFLAGGLFGFHPCLMLDLHIF